jgi:hypothetical protein
MSDYKELTEALALVKELCTIEQIQGLLRIYKSSKDVRITAENKDELVDRNVRAALEAKAIKIEEVFDLIRSSEENGNQHIFYYRPKFKRIGDDLTYDNVAERLWHAQRKTIISGFPAIRLKPNDFHYSDFSVKSKTREEKNPKDWVLKIYGHTLITRSTGETEKRGEHTFWREYVEEPLRIVLLARWNSPDLLELRVQRNESRKRVDGWHRKLWEMLNPALVRGQFDEWELSKPMSRLVREQQQNDSVYTFRDARVVDEEAGVQATFQTQSDGGNLFASIEARESVKNFLKAKSDLNGLTITWHPRSNGVPEKDLRMLLGANEPHELVVLAHCSSEDLDYVTNQLRRSSK